MVIKMIDERDAQMIVEPRRPQRRYRAKTD